jgi:leucyl-tRNA synthetase
MELLNKMHDGARFTSPARLTSTGQADQEDIIKISNYSMMPESQESHRNIEKLFGSIMEYNFREIESKWQSEWKRKNVYKISNDSQKPKYYVLDMFPYPSGAGLHVGHPLGYIASDIFARYKRLKGFNVLHPMGYDAFGLPAEQYAIEHGIHPAASTEQNIKNFRAQLDRIGFCYDWSRAVNTSNPKYYKWTQWIFLKLFKCFYNRTTGTAQSIESLVESFQIQGNKDHPMPNSQFQGQPGEFQLVGSSFSAAEWNSFSELTRQTVLMEYRLAYCGYGEVNWCESLGTVLANDEVINGVSERGGYPVVKKKLRQWYLRITEYADRLLDGLKLVEFSESMKEMQSNWIGKSYGAEIDFALSTESPVSKVLRVYTTRPDTIFGVDFMVIAPEHELVGKISSVEQSRAVEEYLFYVKSRSDRERQAEKKITGCFTGSFAINPFDKRKIPIWISEYVLAGYGTGAIMAVPCGDERDYKFARHFNISISNIIGKAYNGSESNSTKDAILENSGFLSGIPMRAATEIVMDKLQEMGIGKKKVNYKMRDAAFSRQRYWGEPFPIMWNKGIAYPLDENQLPLELPHVESYNPGPNGEGPLANIEAWTARNLETNTMPGYAGSSWYFLRYMDPDNTNTFCDRKASDYWGQVDLYIGGTEHAVGHLLYSRMWTKFLFDLGYIGFDEPYRKLVNQGMIQGSSRFVYRVQVSMLADESDRKVTDIFISAGIRTRFVEKELSPLALYEMISKESAGMAKTTNSEKELVLSFIPLHVDINFVDGVELDIQAFRKWRNGEYASAEFVLEDGKYICGTEVEKMSKRYFNTVNPDDLCEKYGADTFRMYEMFLGPVEQSKPWDTKGIEGVHRFLKKLWRLFYDDMVGKIWNDETPSAAEFKTLHKAIKKIEEDTERFSFNTGVSAAMIAVNELSEQKCHKKKILELLLILIAPYAPHIADELWHLLGNDTTILDAAYPIADQSYLIESTKNYPIALNGKTRAELSISLDATQQEVEEIVLTNETVKKWLDGKTAKKVIYIKNKMINIVV